MKILNLFAGIGGNRTLWGDEHYITTIENNEDVAKIYRRRFPNDHVFVTDAYDFLEDTYDQYDFIWASPPCQSHTKLKQMPNHDKILPDLRLYSIIIFLKTWFKGKWVVENVVPYYDALIKPSIILGRHPFWTNFYIKPKKFSIPEEYRKDVYNRTDPTKQRLKYTELSNEILCKLHHIDWDLIKDFNPKDWKGHDCKRQIMRNCVLPELGKYILDQVGNKVNQQTLPFFNRRKEKNISDII